MKNKSLHRVVLTLLTLGLFFAVGVFGVMEVSVAALASCPANGCRTDRNNNPTAMKYHEQFVKAIGKAGYKEGVDFWKGDVFLDDEKKE